MAMVRNRKLGNSQNKQQPDISAEIKHTAPVIDDEPLVIIKILRILSTWKTILGCLCLITAAYVGMLGYLETRVNTPYDGYKVVEEMGLDIPERYWGSYRPGVYFGMKSREQRSPVFGMMWYDISTVAHKGIRHWCDQNDKLPTYGWIRHDGLSFGEQVISDPPHTIVTSFLKTPGGSHGGDWTARINITSEVPSNFMLVWYGALEDAETAEVPYRLWMQNGEIMGHTPHLDNFKVTLVPQVGTIIHTAYSEAHAPGLHLLKEKFFSLLRVVKLPGIGKTAVVGHDDDMDGRKKQVNFIPIQMLVTTPFVLDIVFKSKDMPTDPVQGDAYTKALSERRKMFDFEFETKFGLEEKGYSNEDIELAKIALSSMVGSIGYFYGAGRVKSTFIREPVPYWKAALYTGVPSRSFFPRGFLWDEGFHGLLIGKWSVDIQMDIAAHWLDLVNVEGWIPREQILGNEALARVPKEFVVQSNTAANPPMLLIQLARIIKRNPQLFMPEKTHRKTLERMYQRLKAWYNWFLSSQKGEEYTSFRWRGREDDGLQLNPKTLTSGLDDYPRASHPSAIERHVDLRCWMFAASESMALIANTLGKKAETYQETADDLGDEGLLDALHWSSETQTYADYGLHTDGVKLTKVHSKNQNEGYTVKRVVTIPPQPQLVTSAFGYVSIFPMLLKVLKPESEKLGKILHDLDKPHLLWSNYGLRSLSKSSPMFMKRNTEHDPPYWRGQVWVNINYLALAALKHYSEIAGPYAPKAKDLHKRLRENVVKNILSEYRRTGYFWEQYSSEDGKGSGCRPFSGWTALVTLIMAEHY